MRLLLLSVILLLASQNVFSQNSKKRNKSDQSTSLEPYYPAEQKAPKKSNKSSNGPTYESEQQYYERMASLEKTKRKNEKLLMKPQYANPLYFGHKRPPKKHKAGKLKFCQECGIRH